MFENEIIKLRKLSICDYEVYHSWRNDMDVMYSTSQELDVYTIEKTEKYMATIASQPNAKGYIIQDKKLIS